jgi:hypothetical protein
MAFPPSADKSPALCKFLRRGAAAIALVTASAGLAYVLPSSAILRRMADARDDLKLFTLKVDGTVTFLGPTAKEAGSALGTPVDLSELSSDAAFLFKFPGRCRVEVTSRDGGALAAVNSHGKARQEGRTVKPLEVALREVCALLAARSSSGSSGQEQVKNHLRGLEIPVPSPTALSRMAGEIAYVIAPKAEKDAESPGQFWVYKGSFMPARVLFTDEDGSRWDVRFIDYTSPATGEWFPRTLEVHLNGEPALRFTGSKASTQAKIPDDAL